MDLLPHVALSVDRCIIPFCQPLRKKVFYFGSAAEAAALVMVCLGTTWYYWVLNHFNYHFRNHFHSTLLGTWVLVISHPWLFGTTNPQQPWTPHQPQGAWYDLQGRSGVDVVCIDPYRSFWVPRTSKNQKDAPNSVVKTNVISWSYFVISFSLSDLSFFLAEHQSWAKMFPWS